MCFVIKGGSMIENFYLKARNKAWSISFIISAASSMPTESRIKLSVMPTSAFTFAVIFLCERSALQNKHKKNSLFNQSKP
jgi:hypothetical protein